MTTSRSRFWRSSSVLRPRRCTTGLSPLVCPVAPARVAPHGDVDDNEIRRLYCDEHRSGAEISKLLGCSASLVYFRHDHTGSDAYEMFFETYD